MPVEFVLKRTYSTFIMEEYTKIEESLIKTIKDNLPLIVSYVFEEIKKAPTLSYIKIIY